MSRPSFCLVSSAYCTELSTGRCDFLSKNVSKISASEYVITQTIRKWYDICSVCLWEWKRLCAPACAYQSASVAVMLVAGDFRVFGPKYRGRVLMCSGTPGWQRHPVCQIQYIQACRRDERLSLDKTDWLSVRRHTSTIYPACQDHHPSYGLNLERAPWKRKFPEKHLYLPYKTALFHTHNDFFSNRNIILPFLAERHHTKT